VTALRGSEAWKKNYPAMSNVFQKSLEQIAEERLSENPKLLSAMWLLHLRLKRGHFAKEWVDALMQSHKDRSDLYDAYGFAILWSAILKGEIYHAVCEIGRQCGRDASIAYNNEILSSVTQIVGQSHTHVRCQAEFSGGLGDSDGHFAWLDTLHFCRHRNQPHTDATLCSYETVSVDACQVPLEVGATSVGTSCGHIFSERGLARWPYGSTRLYLFYAAPALQSRLLMQRDPFPAIDAK
jgi:hypothetical protein